MSERPEHVRRLLFFSLPGNEVSRRRLARFCGRRGWDGWRSRDFPDGESYVRVDDRRGGARRRDRRDARRARTTNCFRSLFLADALRDLGARRVGLVAPYLAYMRQDTRFRAGEAITSRSFASILSAHVDWLITVDPHLHRISIVADLYCVPATAVHASSGARPLDRGERVESPLIIGPDEESRQWVRGVALAASAPSTVLTQGSARRRRRRRIDPESRRITARARPSSSTTSSRRARR